MRKIEPTVRKKKFWKIERSSCRVTRKFRLCFISITSSRALINKYGARIFPARIIQLPSKAKFMDQLNEIIILSFQPENQAEVKNLILAGLAEHWGKIDPTKLDETVTAYIDVTVAFPLLAAYVIQTTKPKKLKRLYDRGDELREKLIRSYLENNKEVGELSGMMKKLTP